MRSYEEQVRIEHTKLVFARAVFIILEIIFAILTLSVLILIPALAHWAGENLKMKITGMAISFLYFAFNCGLTILFQNMAFKNKDDLMITGHTSDCDTIWKYKSEILAERKMKERGLFYPDGAGNFEGK